MFTTIHDRRSPAAVSTLIGVTATVLAATLTAALPATAATAGPVKPRTYRVQAGDSLASIANDFGIRGSAGWRRLFDANRKIDDPDLIEPGTRLRIPARRASLKRRTLPSQPRVPVRASRGAPAVSSTSAAPAGVWISLAACESGGDWSANSGNGYYGGLQFSLSTWQSHGGSGMPHEASAGEQIAVAQRVLASQGWSAWPGCSAELGLG